MTVSVPGPPAEGLEPGGDAPIDPDLAAAVRALATTRAGELTYMRRWLHARPEPSRKEFETTAALRERLEVEGLSPRTLPSGTGLICDIGAGGPLVALRADIDALTMSDAKNVPYRSTNPGVCHACGHDVHMAVVLGAGLVLRDLIDAGRWTGRVRLIFEPSEEAMPGGALDVLAEGGLDGVCGVFGLHCDPKLDAGTIGARIGAITSASDYVRIVLHGPGGHTARPALTVNLTDEAARLVRELPVAIQVDVDELGPVSVPGSSAKRPGEARLVFGTVHSGSASNVIPAEAEITGTLRTPDPSVSDALPAILPRTIARVLGTDVRPDQTGHVGARDDGLHWSLVHQRGVVPVVNDAGATRTVAAAARLAGGPDAVRDTPHSWGGDTFGWYVAQVPGCYARLGTDWPNASRHLDLHRPQFDVDEAAIPFGVKVLALTAIGWAAHCAD
jgi:amidohydrolase